MKMVEQNRRRCLFWTLASLPLYGYGLLGVFIWAMLSMAFNDYKK